MSPSSGAAPSGSSSSACLASLSPSAAARSSSSRSAVTASGLLDAPAHHVHHERDADGALEGAREEDEDRTLPPEPRPREHGELRVAEPHAHLSAKALVEHVERQPDAEEADRATDRRVHDGHVPQREAREAEDRPADGDRVGQVHVLEIDERRGDEREPEREVDGVKQHPADDVGLGREGGEHDLEDRDGEPAAEDLDEQIAGERRAPQQRGARAG